MDETTTGSLRWRLHVRLFFQNHHGNIFTLGWETHRTSLSKKNWDSLSHATWGGGWPVCVLVEGGEKLLAHQRRHPPPTPLALPLLFNGKDKAPCVCSSDKMKNSGSQTASPEISKVVQRRTDQQLPGSHAHAREEACVRAPVNTPVHARTHLLKRVRVYSTRLFTLLARSLGPQDSGSLPLRPLLIPHLVFFHPLTGDK